MQTLDRYNQLLESKKHTTINFGIEPVWMPTSRNLFDYQAYVTELGIRKGRQAQFLDTGLGKTSVALTIAWNYALVTNKRVLIITPIAVAFQFEQEAKLLGIDDIKYSKDGKLTSKIVLCNYERLDKFNPDDFETVILDESSILKNFNGAIKTQVTGFLRKVKYRFLFTATPSPNDFNELGTSSEALGYMGYMDMLKMFFTNNENVIKAMELNDKWVLRPHAKDSFFGWVSSWSVSMRKPSDLGFSDALHVLPELEILTTRVKNKERMIEQDGQVLLWNRPARRLSEVREESKQTIKERCEKAYELTANHDYSVYWTHYNPECDFLIQIDKEAHEIKGGMSVEQKEEMLIAFQKGEIKRLITKPKMTSFGLNWQHCNHSVYFADWSYERYYQAVRRFWRFGQKRKVTIDLVASDGQERVLQTLIEKAEKANELFSKLNSAINNFKETKSEYKDKIILPSFLKGNNNG